MPLSLKSAGDIGLASSVAPAGAGGSALSELSTAAVVRLAAAASLTQSSATPSGVVGRKIMSSTLYAVSGCRAGSAAEALMATAATVKARSDLRMAPSLP